MVCSISSDIKRDFGCHFTAPFLGLLLSCSGVAFLLWWLLCCGGLFTMLSLDFNPTRGNAIGVTVIQ